MADPALSILVDSAGAEAGAKRVIASLDAIQKSATETIKAIEALNKAQKGGAKGSTSGVDGSAKAAVKAHEQAETQKTAITKREAAKRAQIQSNPQLTKLKGEIGQLSAALAKMSAPKINLSTIQRDVRALDRDINKLAKTDLSKLGDSGAAGIKKAQDRASALARQLQAIREEGKRADALMSGKAEGPLTKAQSRTAEAERRSVQNSLSASSPAFTGPVDPKTYSAQINAVKAAETAQTKIFETEAAKRTAIWDKSAAEQQKHTDRIKKEAKAADAQRRAMGAPANSAAFVGPMPETVGQFAKRTTAPTMASHGAPASSAQFVGPMPARAKDLKDTTTEADRLKKKLDELRGMRAATGINASYKEMTKTFEGLTSAVNMGRNALVAYGAVGVAREAVLMADGFVVLTQRVKSATEASGDFLEMNKHLFDMAQANGVAFKDTVGVWQNLSRAAPELGATNDDMLRLTDIVQKLGTIGGSTGDELRYALRQFGQAMSMGTLRAEEMNSLLENTPEIANAIARGMGKTTGQLRAAVLEGKVLSKDVFQALMKQGDQVDAKFSRMAPNIAQGVNRIQNALSKSLGEGSGGMTTEIAKGMGLLADNMDTVIEGALALGTVLAGVFAGKVLGSLTRGIASSVGGFREQTAVMGRLREETLKTAEATLSLAKSQETAAKLAAASAQGRVDTARQAATGAMVGVVGAAPQEKGPAFQAFGAANKEYADAQKDLEVKHAAVAIAAQNSAAATVALTSAQRAATTAARAWSGVMAGLSAVVGALGGPVGALLTALSVGFSLYALSTGGAKDAQKDFNDVLVKFIDLQKEIADTDTTSSAREAAIRQQQVILSNLEADLSKAKQTLKQVREEATSLTSLNGLGNAAMGAADAYTGGALGGLFGKGTLYDQGVEKDTKEASRQVSQAQAAKSTIDVMNNPGAYEDSFMRGIPKPTPIVIDDKATLKFKTLRKDMVEQIRLQRELNGTFVQGAAAVAAFQMQMEVASKIRAIPTDLSPDRQDEMAAMIQSQAQLERDTEDNQVKMQIDEDVRSQKEVARAMGGGPVAARKAEARISARQAADARGWLGTGAEGDNDPDGSKRKALEKSFVAQADAQTAGDFNSEARSSTIGLKAEEKKLSAMSKVGIAREMEMARIEKETDLINQFGSAAGKGAQKMIEQAGAAAKLRAEGELLGQAMDAENQAGGAKKLIDTADFEGDDRNSKTAMLEKRIELEGRYGAELNENAERIIKAAGAQKEYDDLRAQKNELRDSKMDTEGIEAQLSMLREKNSLDAVEIAGMQKAAELKKQYGSATSEVAKMLIEQAKAQERANIALQQEQALNAQRRDTKLALVVGQATIDPKLGNEERSRLIAELQMENELRAQNIDVSTETSRMRIEEAGNLAQVNEYYAQHNDALAAMAMQGRDSYGMLRDAAAVGLGGMENLLTDLITGSTSAKEAFANFAKSVGEQLVRLAVQMMIIRPLAGMLMGGLAGPAPVMAAPSASFVGPMPLMGAMHTGGIVGSDSTPMKPSMSVFAGLPKYHSGGIVGNEQPAILKRGEGVFTENQMKALSPAGGGGSMTVAPTINVQAPPGGSAEDGQRFGKAMSREIESTIVQVMQKQMRNGGVLNPGRGG